MVYTFVLEGPRKWDFGQLPDTPAESIYSTEKPPKPNGEVIRARFQSCQRHNRRTRPNAQRDVKRTGAEAMKKIIAAVVALAVLVVAALFATVLYNGPRMRSQEHLRTYQMKQPLPVDGVLPVNLPEQLPKPQAAAALTNPLPDTAENRRRGQIYYHYYCIFCHGERGEGNGPVGESFMPVPTDLRSIRMVNRDGQLLRAMLLGIGHEPVLERVVPPHHRWYLVLYVQSLGDDR